MTKKELIEQRVAQLMSIGYSNDVAQAEAEALYKDVEEEAPAVKKPRAKKEAAE